MLLFILPIAMAVVVATVGAQERDQGILPLIAAQPIGPRRWWTIRLASLAAVLVPAVMAIVFAASAAAGAPILRAWPEMAGALLLVAAHSLFWVAVAGGCLARGHGAVAIVSTVAGIWLVLTVAVSLAGPPASRYAAPSPSPGLDLGELRQITDGVQADADAIVVQRLAARLGPAGRAIDPRRLDYSTRLIPITEELEARLASQEGRRQDHARATGALARTLSWLSPQLAMQTALSDLAGTGVARHQAFLRGVRTFQLELRSFMYPRVLEQARAPVPRSCQECPARLTFTAHRAIPRFEMPEMSARSRVAAALRAAAWLALLAGGVSLLTVGRCRRWEI